MSSSDASYFSSSDSEAAETEIEGSPNLGEHETSDDEPGDAHAYGSLAPSKGIGWRDIPSVLLGRLLQPKITHLLGIFPLFNLQKRNECGSLQESDQWPGVTTQITLHPDPGSVKYAIFQIFKK